MGFLSSIGDFAKKAVGFVGDIVNPISPLLGLGGSLFSAQQASSGQSANNAQNAQQAALNRVFQDEQARKQYIRYKTLRNTAYSAAMEDMRSSGLNPILAYQQGGASSAMGASPSGNQAVMQNPNALSSQLISQGINSAFSNYQTVNQVDLIKEQVENQPVLRELQRSDMWKKLEETLNLGQQYNILTQELKNMGVTEQKLRQELQMLKKSAAMSDVTLEMMKESPELRKIAALMEILGFRSRNFAP